MLESKAMVTTSNSITFDENLLRELRNVAEKRGTNVDQVAAEAVREYVENYNRVADMLAEGKRAAGEGRTIPHERVKAYIKAKLRGENPEKPT